MVLVQVKLTTTTAPSAYRSTKPRPTSPAFMGKASPADATVARGPRIGPMLPSARRRARSGITALIIILRRGSMSVALRLRWPTAGPRSLPCDHQDGRKCCCCISFEVRLLDRKKPTANSLFSPTIFNTAGTPLTAEPPSTLPMFDFGNTNTNASSSSGVIFPTGATKIGHNVPVVESSLTSPSHQSRAKEATTMRTLLGTKILFLFSQHGTQESIGSAATGAKTASIPRERPRFGDGFG